MSVPAPIQPLSKIERLHQIVARHGAKVSNLVGILQDVQAEYRYLPEEALTYIAGALDVPPAMVFGVATFYSQFTMSPRGRYVIKVCDGTACHVRGSERINFAIREAAGLPPEGPTTTPDLKFTVERVACVGACGLAPVVMVDDREVFGELSPEEAARLVYRLAEREEAPPPPSRAPACDTDEPTPAARPLPQSPPAIRGRAGLERAQERFRRAVLEQKVRMLVCMETACVANGAREVYAALRRELDARGLRAELDVLAGHASDAAARCGGDLVFGHDRPLPAGKGEAGLVKAGCHGYCQIGPLVVLEPGRIVYARVRAEDAAEIVTRTVEKGQLVERLLHREPASPEPFVQEASMPFYAPQRKITLATTGRLDCEDIREYLAFGGYGALARALFDLTPDEVIAEVQASGLRGRGGGGFPTGQKWAACRQAAGRPKYVVCNADEGDPGAFMDRSLLEGDPHRVLEGMAIAAYAVGAGEAFVYVRAEYPLAVRRIRRAIAQARAYGLLGPNILGSGYSLEVHVKEGAGAFVCGEETALLASIEGRRGMPRPRPPFPAAFGLWGCPTLINNVETLATVPFIIREGARAFRRYGTPSSPGTKTFALAGQVARTGLIEVPLGTTLRQVVFEIGGGMRRGRPFKAVQIGGPSGGCLTAEHLDLPLDFDSLRAAGAMVGSGGLVVLDQGTCMVEMARFFMRFVQDESCGKCVPCREGTRHMLKLLERMTAGRAGPQDLELLEELAAAVAEGSLCGLGRTAPNPVLTTLRYFRDEYLAHILERRCPAGVCHELLDFRVLAERCTGCGACLKACPADAISGERKQPHVIDVRRCLRCGACLDRCRFAAIVRGTDDGEVVA